MMMRTIVIFGCIAGLIEVAAMYGSMAAGLEGGTAGLVVGYLSMLVALSMVFVGIKKYRDEHLGGAISFGTALLVGFGIAAIATIIYAAAWEFYLAMTDYRFMPEYAARAVAAKRASGASPEEVVKMAAEMHGYVVAYRNPVTRTLMTMSEIAPVAVVMTLLAATLLRRPGFMAKRAG